MKYVRTKNKLYESKRKLIEQDCLVIGEKENGEIGLVKEDIIKQSDSIVDLCDEFMAINDSMDLPILDSFEKICLLLTTKKHKDDKVYGAIWITLPNGAPRLEPVAKLNDNGDWKLL